MTQTEDKPTREHLSNLPEGWITAALGEACIVTQGQSPPGETYNNEGKGLPFLQGKAEFGATYPNAVKWCTAPSKISEPGDVLISVRAPVGPANLCAVQSCIGRGLAAIRSQADIPAKYVLYAIRATEQELRAKSTGTTFEAIRGADLRSHIIPLAPLPEQHRIVAEIEKQFTRLDASVAALERVRAKLKRFRASVLKTACKGELVKSEADLAQSEDRQYESANVLLGSILTRRQMRWESKHEGRRKYKEPIVPDISQLPVLAKGWAWASMAHIADIQGGFQKQPKRIPKENSFPYLRVANVQRGKLTLDEVYAAELFAGELEKLRLVRGDLLIVEGNGSQSQIGRMAIWNDEIADCVHQNHIIRARPHEGIIPAFVECYWNSPEGSARVHSIASSTSGLYTLSVSKVSQLPVPIPPIAEQRRIVAEVERRLSVIQQIEEAVDTSLKRAERLRQSVLKQAFCGQLVPQDPGDEPAFALLERILAERAEAQVAAEASNKRGRRTRRNARAVS